MAQWLRHCSPETIDIQRMKLQALNIDKLHIDYKIIDRTSDERAYLESEEDIKSNKDIDNEPGSSHHSNNDNENSAYISYENSQERLKSLGQDSICLEETPVVKRSKNRGKLPVSPMASLLKYSSNERLLKLSNLVKKVEVISQTKINCEENIDLFDMLKPVASTVVMTTDEDICT